MVLCSSAVCLFSRLASLPLCLVIYSSATYENGKTDVHYVVWSADLNKIEFVPRTSSGDKLQLESCAVNEKKKKIAVVVENDTG